MVFESDCNNLLYELFLDLKVLILEKGLIINYKFKNPLSWIIFYIKEVYPIIRRGGLVFINAGDTKKQIIRIF